MSKSRKDAGYRPVRSVHIAPDRCSRKIITLLNQYAKAQGMPVQKATVAILQEVLSAWRAAGTPKVQV